MSVKTYSSTDQTQITAHFNVQEFKCKCGQEHDILLSDELLCKLEQLRDALNCSKIIVTSGYRCPEHDAAVSTGGGQHTKGTAADICCYGQDGQPISSKTVCCKAQDIGFTGIANITSDYIYTHADVRTGSKWYGDEVCGNDTVTDDFYSYFGIADTSKIVAKGIDVSYAQGNINWSHVKLDGVQFAIIRAGYGRELSQKDSQFENNYAGCKSNGVPVGAYWYSYAQTAAEARQEAAVCLQVLKGKTFEYPIAFDIEEQKSLANASELCSAFCSELEAAGYYAAVYSFKSALESNISGSVKEKYDVFLAHVGVEKSSYAGNYGLWQYSWEGSVNGISADVDLDYAYKDYPSIIKNAGLNGFAKPVSESGAENLEQEETETSDSEKSTLEQILDHVASIDEKIK